MSVPDDFRAHVYGTNMSNSCIEADVVKMIIEMLLGSTNDLFGMVHKQFDKLCRSDDIQNPCDISIQVFHLTPFALHTRVDKLSPTLLQGILKWFGQFGSHLYICRKFALHSHSGVELNHRTELVSAVLDTMRSSISDLLTAVEEALCDFEQKVLELPLSEGQALHHSRLEYTRRITLIALYQRCLSWQPLFQSLAGLVCSAMPVSALHALLEGSEHTLNNTDTIAPTIVTTGTTSATSQVDTVFEKLAVRGILQEMGEMLRLGGLVDIHPSMRLLTNGIKSSRNKSGVTTRDIHTKAAINSTTTSRINSSASINTNSTIDVSLTLSLSSLHRSEFFLYARLLHSALLEKYLTNLVSMVWATNTTSGAGTGTSSNSSVLGGSIKPQPHTPNANKTQPNTPASTNKNHLIYKSHRDVGAIDSVLHTLSSPATGTARQHRHSSRGATSTLAARKKHRRVVQLLLQARELVQSSAQYEVPDFLLPITQEAIVSARDVLILQKAHIQRQNPSYNLSSLKALVRDSVLEYRRALLPHHHSINSASTTGGTTGGTNISTTTISSPTLPLSRADRMDPVVSYLLTGQSVKIVGIRSAPLVLPHKGSAAKVSGAGISSANKENTSTSTNTHTTTPHSLTLASYSGGGVTSNSEYLSVLLAQRTAQLATVRSALNSVVGAVGGVHTVTGDDVVNSEEGRSNHSVDVKQSLIDRVSRVLQHSRLTASAHARTASTVPTSELVLFVTSAAKLRVSLLHRLLAQLRMARADSAEYVLRTHGLQAHLRYVRDVFFLGVPDFYAPIRELCLNLTEWKKRVVRGGSVSSSTNRNNNNIASSTAFIGEALAGTMLEKAPSSGIRHLSVAANPSSGRDATSGVGAPASLQSKLAACTANLGSSSSIPAAHTTRTIHAATPDIGDVVDLFAIIASMNISLLHQHPLVLFLDPSSHDALNANMRFLLLLTACRWTAEYWWMDAVSNHSLNTSSFTAPSHRSASAPPSPTKLSSPFGHGALYPTSDSTFSTNPMRAGRSSAHTHSTPTTPTKAGAPSADYLADVLQAKRNCRAGLAIWLHTVTAINNVFMAHIHRTLWPAFEAALHTHRASLLHMQSEFQRVLSEADASLMLLREEVLGIVVKGFSAATSMRAAVVLEYSEISVVEAQNKQLAALHDKIHKLSPLHKSSSDKINEDKPKKVLRNPRVAMRDIPKTETSDATSARKVYYTTSAGVLVAYRAAEEAFAELKRAVEELKYKVEREVRRSNGRGSVGREVRAMEELLMHLCA